MTYFIFGLVLFSTLFAVFSAAAGDKALILNDQEQAALMHAIDAATKAEGLQIAPSTVYLMNKLNQAGTVTERKEPDPPKPAKEGDR